MSQRNVTLKSIYTNIKVFLASHFDLSIGKASEAETILEIKQNIVFKGSNLWILIFAILIASIGLDVNNTAIIIGAMLISPLMGPIMGIGLGVGINDFQLIIQAFKNLGIAVLISILTSALYFWISPLNVAQSELLARTSPDIWDVFIGLFGGLAGIVAGSRAEKSNAIPGVAIATALMPPLCTAGFGVATGQWNFFFGACYLFWINSVFICFATIVVVRVLRFRNKEFLDDKREKKVKRYIAILVVATVIPSIYSTFNVVSESFFKSNANEFISEEFSFDSTHVINRNLEYSRSGSMITVTVFGQPISQEMIDEMEEKMPQYKLDKCTLRIRQANQPESVMDLAAIELLNQKMRTGIIEDLYRRNEDQIKNRDDQIQLLEKKIISYQSKEIDIASLVAELKVIDPNVETISVTPAVLSNIDSSTTDTTYLAYVHFRQRHTDQDTQKLAQWLRARLKTQKIKVVQD